MIHLRKVPVACKACPCGHSFFNARRNTAPGVPPGDDIRRRTQRVRREKPNYYDALVIDKQTRKVFVLLIKHTILFEI